MGAHFPLQSAGKRPASPLRPPRPLRHERMSAVEARALFQTGGDSARPRRRLPKIRGDNQDARCEADRIELTLPAPPSANGLFANRAVGGRTKTQGYKDWIAEAGWRLQQQHPGRIAGAYEIEIRVARTEGADIDNRVKALSDLLVKHRVVEDDSLAEKLTVSWMPPGSGVVVILTKAAVQ